MTTRSTLDLRPHVDAEHVPAPDTDTYDQMVEDIATRGVQVPLDILDDGTVLDGRTRLAIAMNLGLADVPVRVVEPDDPYDYMLRAALMRRDLTKSQRAALAIRLPEYQTAKAEATKRATRGKAPDPSAVVREGGKAAASVADTVGVSPRLVEQAEQVARVAPDLLPAIERGETTIAQAMQRAEERIRETTPEVAESHRAMLFAKAMKAHGLAQMHLGPEEWAAGLDASDAAVMRGHVIGTRQWIEAWERALDRPALRLVGGER